jgi:hypothetical protein
MIRLKTGHWKSIVESQYKPEAEIDVRHIDLWPEHSGPVVILAVIARL